MTEPAPEFASGQSAPSEQEAQSGGMSRRRYLVLLAAVIVFGTLVYASTLDAGFTFDDVQTIRGHVGVHGPFSLQNIFLRDFWGFTFDRTVGSWRPLATLTFWMDWHLGSGRPWMFHLTNLLVHAGLLLAGNAFLERWAGEALGQRGRLLTLAAFAALVIHVDVVPSASGRAEMLAALFILLATWVAIPPQRAIGWAAAGASGALVGLALLSKESAFPMALVVPYLVARHHHRQGTFHWKQIVPLVAICAAVLAAVVWFRAGRLPFAKDQAEVLADTPILALPWHQQKLGAFEVLTHYLEHFVTGLNLVPDYSYSSIHVTGALLSLRTILGMACYGALGLIIIRQYRRVPILADAAIGFLGSFLVASHLVIPASAMVADRLFFFPSFWLTVLLGLLIVRIPAASAGQRRLGPRFLVVIGAVGLTAVQGVIAAAAATNWHDDAALLTHALQSEPHVARTRVNLSMVLYNAGRYEDAAWHMLLAHVYYRHFPTPLSDSDYPGAWDDLPAEERLSELRATLGDAIFVTALQRTKVSCEEWNQVETARLIGGWLAVIEPSQ